MVCGIPCGRRQIIGEATIAGQGKVIVCADGPTTDAKVGLKTGGFTNGNNIFILQLLFDYR